MLDRFFSTLSLVSRIPIKGRFSFDPSGMDFYLPITGLFPAFLGALVFWGGAFFMDSPILVVIMLILQYGGFNLFHLDGLVDTADAFLGNFSREKRIAILKDSRIGVYGLFAGIAVLSLKAALLYSLLPFIEQFPASVLAYPISGRFSAALLPALVTPLRPEGLGSLAKDTRPWRAVAGTLISLLLWTAIVWGCLVLVALFPFRLGQDLTKGAPFAGIIHLALPVTGVLSAVFFARLYGKHLGGYTGDALGAAIEIGELLHLAGAYGAMLYRY
ncbi:MAG: adenosylcobinamide-GDP ribazoletransferase [Treponema sp.]|jgi:adenosylcobinamide-GDP ribazoletransferase|nr:adenosylcobinamide-GDP ribazoletransferase [Treponema sp.]